MNEFRPTVQIPNECLSLDKDLKVLEWCRDASKRIPQLPNGKLKESLQLKINKLIGLHTDPKSVTADPTDLLISLEESILEIRKSFIDDPCSDVTEMTHYLHRHLDGVDRILGNLKTLFTT